MTHPSLASVDLNLLVAFDALFEERSVTRAGRRLGLSQPAMSGVLLRLRTTLGDPLFVRARGGLVPTERATSLAPAIAQVLRDIHDALAGAAFDPATTDRRMTIGAVDAAIAVVMPDVAAAFVRAAPRAHLTITSIDPARAVDLVDAGALDVALSPLARNSSTVRQKILFHLDFLIAMRVGHPLARRPLTASALDRFPRLRVAFGETVRDDDSALSVSSFLAAPHILAQTDAWTCLPAPFAKQLASNDRIVARPLPASIAAPKLAMRMFWPETHDASPASRFLRALIVDAASRRMR